MSESLYKIRKIGYNAFGIENEVKIKNTGKKRVHLTGTLQRDFRRLAAR